MSGVVRQVSKRVSEIDTSGLIDGRQGSMNSWCFIQFGLLIDSARLVLSLFLSRLGRDFFVIYYEFSLHVLRRDDGCFPFLCFGACCVSCGIVLDLLYPLCVQVFNLVLLLSVWLDGWSLCIG